MEGDLASFVDHARAVLAGDPSLSQRTTDLRITLPLLRTLGWDVHGADVVAEYEVSGADAGGDGGAHGGEGPDDGEAKGSVTVDYALFVDGEPAAFLVTAGLDEGIDPAHGRRLEAAMAAAGVEYGLVAAGDAFAFVAGGAEDPERVRCSLSELPDRRSVLAHYTRGAARRRRDRRRGEARAAAVADLADRRAVVANAVGEALSGGFEDPVRTELEAAGEAVVDAVIDALAAGDHPRRGIAEANEGADGAATGGGSGGDAAPTETHGGAGTDAGGAGSRTGSGSGTEATGEDERGPDPDPASGSEPGATAAERRGEGADAEGRTGASDAGDRTGAGDGEAADPDRHPGDEGVGIARSTGDSDSESEYVVRFFDGSDSVGAVGHGTAPGSLVQAVEYLIAHRGIEGNVSLPWGPSDDRAVLNHDPVHPDGAEMVDAAELSNGYYVCTTIDPEGIREALEELAAATGLRVMFQGDW